MAGGAGDVAITGENWIKEELPTETGQGRVTFAHGRAGERRQAILLDYNGQGCIHIGKAAGCDGRGRGA